MQQFDLAIIGGGLVGASFARAVSGLGLSVVLIDKAPVESLYNKSLDNRGLALSYTTAEYLDVLKCWEKICKKTYPIETIHVSEQKRFGFTILESKKYNLECLGYVVSASDLGAALLNGIEVLSDITVWRPATIDVIEFDKLTSTWNLSVAQQKIAVNLIVAADGSNSILHQVQNISIQNVNMQQSALVTNLETSISNFTTAFERFTKDGVLALLPFGTNRVKCVFTGSNAVVSRLAELSNKEFVALMQKFIGYRLGRFISVEERKMFPVSQAYADRIYGDSMVLLGNAANTLHPVAAQGFNLGVRDAITLAKVLQQAISTNTAINNSAVLEQYANLRANDHAKTREFTARLVDVFADPRPYMQLYRQAGILAAQFVPTLNRKIIQHGIGSCK